MGELDDKLAAIRERHADKSLYYPAFCYEDVGFLLKALDARDATIAELNAECHKIDEHYIAEMNKSDRLEAEVSPLTHHLKNLLARIHRDGGHYTEKHGIAKASEDAEQIVVAMRAERDEAAATERERCASIVDWTCEKHPVANRWTFDVMERVYADALSGESGTGE